MSKYVIIYDNHCGICNTGARVFTRSGLIKEEGVMQLSDLQDSEFACHVDPIRSCDEMAVVNKETNAVDFGMDA